MPESTQEAPEVALGSTGNGNNGNNGDGATNEMDLMGADNDTNGTGNTNLMDTDSNGAAADEVAETAAADEGELEAQQVPFLAATATRPGHQLLAEAIQQVLLLLKHETSGDLQEAINLLDIQVIARTEELIPEDFKPGILDSLTELAVRSRGGAWPKHVVGFFLAQEGEEALRIRALMSGYEVKECTACPEPHLAVFKPTPTPDEEETITNPMEAMLQELGRRLEAEGIAMDVTVIDMGGGMGPGGPPAPPEQPRRRRGFFGL